ncbi:Hypothetical protein GbCGDNIH2_7283 [Granulibacter bethesdensis]|nr:Hypothetical protein GbCGDNIH2_7283 [Granulibacter bethesdensis]
MLDRCWQGHVRQPRRSGGHGGKLCDVLRYQLEWGDAENQLLIKLAEEQEWDDLPSRPELRPGATWIWRAWNRLDSERPHTVTGFSIAMGGSVTESVPRPIPWRAVRAWARYHRLSDAAFAVLDHCIAALDRVYIAAWWEGYNRRMETMRSAASR